MNQDFYFIYERHMADPQRQYVVGAPPPVPLLKEGGGPSVDRT